MTEHKADNLKQQAREWLAHRQHLQDTAAALLANETMPLRLSDKQAAVNPYVLPEPLQAVALKLL